MIWLLWRQHRLQFSLAAIALALFAVPMAITGLHLADALQACQQDNGCSGFDLLQHYNPMVVVTSVTVLVPLLVGVFWGATIIGKELDNGTATLVWSQSVTRRRWVRAKLITLFVSATVTGGVVAGLVTWWSDAHNATVESRFAGLQFDIQGVAPVGYAIFAAALGLASGVLWRRVLPAMATTVGGFIAVRFVVELFVRSHYRTPITTTTLMSAGRGAPDGSWVMSTDLVVNGHVVSGPVQAPIECTSPATRGSMDRCLDDIGYRLRTVYQPSGRYWSFQWIETGIFVGLAAVLVAVAVVTLRRHDA
jgi:hypothetical protein